MVAARSCGRRTNGTIRCWPCHIAMMKGRSGVSQMSVVTRIARSRAAQESLGFLGASYLKLVQGTNRIRCWPCHIAMMKGRSGVSQS
jgi:hypothetical protein